MRIGLLRALALSQQTSVEDTCRNDPERAEQQMRRVIVPRDAAVATHKADD